MSALAIEHGRRRRLWRKVGHVALRYRRDRYLHVTFGRRRLAFERTTGLPLPLLVRELTEAMLLVAGVFRAQAMSCTCALVAGGKRVRDPGCPVHR